MNYITVTILLGRKAIRIMWRSTPRSVTTQAALRKVDVEHHLVARLDIGVVHLILLCSWVEVLRAVRHGADAQWLKTLNAENRNYGIPEKLTEENKQNIQTPPAITLNN